MKYRRYCRRRRGYMFLDAIVGMGVLATVAGAMLAAETGYQRFARSMADQRAAMQHAEAALAQLRTGQTPPQTPSIVIVDLFDSAPAGHRWVRIDAVEPHGRAALVGLIRSGS